MKQRITIEQLNELTEAQKQTLRGWWKPQEGDTVLVNSGILKNFITTISQDDLSNQIFKDKPDGYFPLLNIGRMIELLDNKGKDISFNLDCTILGCELWIDGTEYGRGYGHSELCDALWEACKQVLGNG